MDKRILTVALATLLAACGGGNAEEGGAAQDTVPAGATIEGTSAPATAPLSTDSAASMGAADVMAPAMTDSAAGAMTAPAMGTDTTATKQ